MGQSLWWRDYSDLCHYESPNLDLESVKTEQAPGRKGWQRGATCMILVRHRRRKDRGGDRGYDSLCCIEMPRSQLPCAGTIWSFAFGKVSRFDSARQDGYLTCSQLFPIASYWYGNKSSFSLLQSRGPCLLDPLFLFCNSNLKHIYLCICFFIPSCLGRYDLYASLSVLASTSALLAGSPCSKIFTLAADCWQSETALRGRRSLQMCWD